MAVWFYGCLSLLSINKWGALIGEKELRENRFSVYYEKPKTSWADDMFVTKFICWLNYIWIYFRHHIAIYNIKLKIYVCIYKKNMSLFRCLQQLPQLRMQIKKIIKSLNYICIMLIWERSFLYNLHNIINTGKLLIVQCLGNCYPTLRISVNNPKYLTFHLEF